MEGPASLPSRSCWRHATRSRRAAAVTSPSWAPGQRPEGDEHEDPCDGDQDEEQVTPAGGQRPQSSDGYGEARQQDRDAPKTGEQSTEVSVVSDPDHVEEVEHARHENIEERPPPELVARGAAHEFGVLAEDRLDGLAERHELGS